MSQAPVIGFVGLGNIGGPMARNIALKHDGDVLVHDVNPGAFPAVEGTRAARVATLGELASRADIVFMSLPGNAQVEAVVLGPDGLASVNTPPAIIVDLSTTSVATARRIAAELAERGIDFADAPVARTVAAARRGELSIMVGASPQVYERIASLLAYMGSDITHCGAVGAGQVVKLVNNALVFEHTAALAEMLVLGSRAGVEPEALLQAISKGSGDSFVLRNHGMKAMLPREFPADGFPPEYALKDLAYVLELAEQTGTSTDITALTRGMYASAVEKGLGRRYFPCIVELIEGASPPGNGGTA